MLGHIKALILDMDGVLWRDDTPIGDLPAIFARLRERGLKVALATNNASKTVDEYLEKFSGFGVKLEPWQIVTSSLATADVLTKEFPSGGQVFVIGGNGIQRALEERGFQLIIDPDDETKPLAVVAGIDRFISYAKLRRATLHIRAGVPFYGTNPDKTFPTPQGLVPGAGAILAAIEAATDVKPVIIGKPAPTMMYMALEKLGTQPEETLVVGDRLETDIAAGQAGGCKTALMLSGVSTKEQAENWKPSPDVIVKDFAVLLS
ncbi:MAG: HAD-IIA family hydrolase [Anaerolineales bacterium]|nr:HAD-IIA family hydrolase [Anaerolineales bacterium]